MLEYFRFDATQPHHIPIDFVDSALLALEIDASTRDGFSRSTFRTRSQASTRTHTYRHCHSEGSRARAQNDERVKIAEEGEHTKTTATTQRMKKRSKKKNEQKRKFQNSEIPKNPFLSLLLVIRCLFVCAHA